MSTNLNCPENAYPENGSCVCKPGYFTATCVEKCNNGTYGLACREKCTSCAMTECHHVTGCPAPSVTSSAGSVSTPVNPTVGSSTSSEGFTPTQNNMIIYLISMPTVVVLIIGLFLFFCCRKKKRRDDKHNEKSSVHPLIQSGENSDIKGCTTNLYYELDDDGVVRDGDKGVGVTHQSLATAVYDTADVGEEHYHHIVLKSDLQEQRVMNCRDIDETYDHLASKNKNNNMNIE